MKTDLVQLVDEFDHELGVMDKIEAHRGHGRRHRAISVFLFNSQNRLLIQQRSEKKIVGALQWANTCCGNVLPGESYEQCAKRRLEYEWRITQVIGLKPLYTFEYHIQCNAEFSEWEIDQVFVGQYNGKVYPNPDEVMAYNWIPSDIIRKDMKKNPNTYAPWFFILMEKNRKMGVKI